MTEESITITGTDLAVSPTTSADDGPDPSGTVGEDDPDAPDVEAEEEEDEE